MLRNAASRRHNGKGSCSLALIFQAGEENTMAIFKRENHGAAESTE
jgi:hypothetical protein